MLEFLIVESFEFNQVLIVFFNLFHILFIGFLCSLDSTIPSFFLRFKALLLLIFEGKVGLMRRFKTLVPSSLLKLFLCQLLSGGCGVLDSIIHIFFGFEPISVLQKVITRSFRSWSSGAKRST